MVKKQNKKKNGVFMLVFFLGLGFFVANPVEKLLFVTTSDLLKFTLK